MTTASFKTIRYLIALLLTTMFTALVFNSCSKEADTNSVAYRIAESEKLVIPAAIDLPANSPNGNTRVATYYAIGVQKYKAQPKAGSPGIYEWVFVAPQADLYDASNKKVGTHSAGPTWQLLGTADSIYGKQFAPAKAVASPDPNSIDWLQLTIKKAPTGVFSNVEYIQRIATKEGKAPQSPPTNADETADIHYTAIYRFSKRNL